MKKLFKSISLITLTLILTLGLFGCGKKPVSNENSNNNQNQNVNVVTSTNATSTAEIDVSNWKTYKNEEYGFEFKYPENKVLRIQNNEIGIGLSDEDITSDAQSFEYKYFGEVVLKILKNKNRLSVQDYYNKLEYNVFSDNRYSSLEINNHHVYEFLNLPGLVTINMYIISLNNNIIEISEVSKSNYVIEIIKSLK